MIYSLSTYVGITFYYWRQGEYDEFQLVKEKIKNKKYKRIIVMLFLYQ